MTAPPLTQRWVREAVAPAQMLMPASWAAASISASSSSLNSRLPSASMFASSCFTEDAPTSAEVTVASPWSRRIQAIAIWASVCPRFSAIPLRRRTIARLSSLSISELSDLPAAARESAGTPSR